MAMSLVLKPEQKEFVAQQVALGRFQSEDEVWSGRYSFWHKPIRIMRFGRRMCG